MKSYSTTIGDFATSLKEAQVRLEIGEARPKKLAPVAYTVGDHHNLAGENPDTLTILVDAVFNDMTVRRALESFQGILIDVLLHPRGTNQPNIRALLKISLDTKVTEVVTFHGPPILTKIDTENLIELA